MIEAYKWRYIQLYSTNMVFLEWVGTGLLFFVHKVKFVARAYEYQAGSDRVCLCMLTRF